MAPDMLDRRSFLTGLAGLTLPLLGAGRAKAGDGAKGGSVYISSARKPDGSFAAVLLDGKGNILLSESLSDRGHDAAVSPDGNTVVLFARRPGRLALVIDVVRRAAIRTILCPAGRHFYGHGVFSADGRVLYASENQYDTGTGLLGLYDAARDFAPIGTLDTGGIGPHEMLLMADRRTIAVAIGGILTHPDYGHKKLNLADMRPSLAYLDTTTGIIVEQVHLPEDLHRLSIRHIAADAAGGVWFGGQFQGSKSRAVPLVGRHRRGEDLHMIAGSAEIAPRFRNYVGAVTANRAGTRIATSSPRGDIVAIWDHLTGEIVAKHQLADACGVAAGSGSGFTISSGAGHLLDSTTGKARRTPEAWDNHLRRVGGST